MESSLISPIHLRATDRFIQANPSQIQMVRQERIPTGTGGFTLGNPDTLEAIVIRRVGRSLGQDFQERVSANGHTVTATYVIIAMPDADIRKGDTFTLRGRTCEVLYTDESPPWRIRVEVYER